MTCVLQVISSWSKYAFCCLTLTSLVLAAPQAFHFNRFSGPVSGPISRVDVPRHAHHNGPVHGPSVDYVAKPDYSFAYGVEDPLTGNYQNQKEVRDGDVVKGEYSVVDADGITRRVTYTADPKNGFQATVHLSEPNSEHASQQQQFANSINRGADAPSGNYVNHGNHVTHGNHHGGYNGEFDEDY